MRERPALRLASESIRNWPDSTTLSPALRPLRISVDPPISIPTSTSCWRNFPSPSASTTRLRSPVRITASLGTSTACVARPLDSMSVANMPGFSFAPGLATSMRARRVRVTAFTSGRIAPTRPVNTSPGYAGTRASTRLPGTSQAACASGTSALTQTLERSTMRNSGAPAMTVMPSRTLSSAITPEMGERNVKRASTLPSRSTWAMSSAPMPSSARRWRAASASGFASGEDCLRNSRYSSCAPAHSGKKISTSGPPLATGSSGDRAWSFSTKPALRD